MWGKSRGYIFFRPSVYGLKVKDNVFISPEKSDEPNYGIILENPDGKALVAEGNVFMGKIDSKVVTGKI